MEPKAEYKTETVAERREHKCSKCQAVYGFETSDGYLMSGSIVVQFIKGYCANCGNKIRWFSNDERLERLLKGRKNRKLSV
jgi:hypothetical protein